METMVPDDVTREILARYEAAELIISCAWCRRIEFDDATATPDHAGRSHSGHRRHIRHARTVGPMVGLRRVSAVVGPARPVARPRPA